MLPTYVYTPWTSKLVSVVVTVCVVNNVPDVYIILVNHLYKCMMARNYLCNSCGYALPAGFCYRLGLGHSPSWLRNVA
jgi:hypothetical protein